MQTEKIIELRKALHQHPEVSMKEARTKAILMEFIKQNTNFDIVDRGAWFYAARSGEKTQIGESERARRGRQPPIAFRADFDAVLCADGKARHLCGHDGHSAALAGLAASLGETDRDVYLIFQPGEEIGAGARLCAELIEEKGIGEIYGFHNIPGHRENAIILPDGTFACASTGLKIDLKGKITHAAYPEEGNNPAPVMAELVSCMEALEKEPHKGVLLGTVIGMEAGGDSYGVAAGSGQLRLTLRAQEQDEFDRFVAAIENRAKDLSREAGLECRVTRVDEFPATVNDPECAQKLRAVAERSGLALAFPEEPFRWSEDFGCYLQKTKGAFFGIGCGEDHPGLHTEAYEYNDAITATAIRIFKGLI